MRENEERNLAPLLCGIHCLPCGIHCGIKRLPATRSYVGVWGDAAFEGDVIRLLADLVSRKIDKLKRFVPKILLLVDRYYVADADACPRAIECCDGIDVFHSVFLVDADKRVFQIHPKEAVKSVET